MTDPARRATVECPFCSRLNAVALARAADRPRCGECGRPLLLDRPVRVSEAAFDRVLGGTDVPVLVDFYADWCGPCHMMAPALDQLASERLGGLLVAKVDTDRSPALSSRFAIASLPTVVLFSGGREVARRVGALPKQGLVEMVEGAGTVS
jgi:thioredoxin 2